jgi:hypothetical protein
MVRMKVGRRAAPLCVAFLLIVTGCARGGLVMDLSGGVMYEKPHIEDVTHSLTDGRTEGGPVVLNIVMHADPGLRASFDISPGIASREPLKETTSGIYEGTFSFNETTVGGPYSLFGRVSHEKAGEVVLRDPRPITITILDRGL